MGPRRQGEQVTPAVGAAPGEEARPYGHAQAVAPLAETRGRHGGPRAWLGGAGPSCVPVWFVRMSRGDQGARALVGERCAGRFVTERSRAYTCYRVRWRQRGWAPGLREADAMRDRGGASEERGEAWLAQAHPMLTGWQRGRGGTRHRATFRASMPPLRRAGERRLEAGRGRRLPKTAGPCRESLQRCEAWWTFVPVAGVAPTKNTAERASRPAGRWRQGSWGTQRAEGARFVASLLTGVATGQPPPRHVLASRTAACEAALRGEAAPSLRPASDPQAQAAA